MKDFFEYLTNWFVKEFVADLLGVAITVVVLTVIFRGAMCWDTIIGIATLLFCGMLLANLVDNQKEDKE